MRSATIVSSLLLAILSGCASAPADAPPIRWAIAIHGGAGTIDRLQKALLSLSDEKLLAAFGRKRLIEAKNEDFEGVAAVARKLDMLR